MAELRDLSGRSLPTVLLNPADPGDVSTIKYSVRKHLDRLVATDLNQHKPFGSRNVHGVVQEVVVRRFRDATGVGVLVDLLGVAHCLTARLPEQFYVRDLHNAIDQLAEKCKTLAQFERRGERIFSREEYEAVYGRDLRTSPVELF